MTQVVPAQNVSCDGPSAKPPGPKVAISFVVLSARLTWYSLPSYSPNRARTVLCAATHGVPADLKMSQGPLIILAAPEPATPVVVPEPPELAAPPAVPKPPWFVCLSEFVERLSEAPPAPPLLDAPPGNCLRVEVAASPLPRSPPEFATWTELFAPPLAATIELDPNEGRALGDPATAPLAAFFSGEL